LELDDQLREKFKHNLRKQYAGQVLYSDVIGKGRKELHLWNLVLNRLQQRRVDTRKIRCLMHSTGQHRALQMELLAALRAQKVDEALVAITPRPPSIPFFGDVLPQPPKLDEIPFPVVL
jgi:hypothetical protein